MVYTYSKAITHNVNMQVTIGLRQKDTLLKTWIKTVSEDASNFEILDDV